MLENVVYLHTSTDSTSYNQALAQKLFHELRARSINAEYESSLVRFAASSTVTVEVVLEDITPCEEGSVSLALGTGGGTDVTKDSRTVIAELERRDILPCHDKDVYSEEEEAAVARRLEALGYLG